MSSRAKVYSVDRLLLWLIYQNSVFHATIWMPNDTLMEWSPPPMLLALMYTSYHRKFVTSRREVERHHLMTMLAAQG